MKLMSQQLSFRPAVKTVTGNIDYARFERELVRIDEILRKSGAEQDFIEKSVKRYTERGKEAGSQVQAGHIKRHQERSLTVLRSMVLQCLLGEDYRGMSCRLAECPLFRWFCQIETLDEIRVPSKSVLQTYAHWLPEEEMREVVGTILRASNTERDALELANDIELNRVWMDSTAIKANIHFPVDWVLLRDAVRTLTKATKLIREHGLKCRMSDPKTFMSDMNQLSMQMTQCRRKQDAKPQRKKTLRKMKRLVKTVAAHARSHRELLDKEWERSDWTRKQAEQVLKRIDGVLELLPQAQKQAHERIIGERKVSNAEKILSLYEREARVIVRGKIDAEIEFGNTLLLAEQENGIIIDWQMHKESAPADSKLLQKSIERIEALTEIKVTEVGTDRGFDSSDNVAYLKQRNIKNGICPKSPAQLKERMKNRKFVVIQKRRASTEGRIGIFKNVFVGKPLRAKGFSNRELAISWRILAHNLWVLARLKKAEQPLALAA